MEPIGGGEWHVEEGNEQDTDRANRIMQPYDQFYYLPILAYFLQNDSLMSTISFTARTFSV